MFYDKKIVGVLFCSRGLFNFRLYVLLINNVDDEYKLTDRHMRAVVNSKV